MKHLTFTMMLFLTNTFFSQNNYGFHSVFDAYKSNTQIENISLGQITAEHTGLGARFDYLFVGTFGSKI